jgi:hypothetical protein
MVLWCDVGSGRAVSGTDTDKGGLFVQTELWSVLRAAVRRRAPLTQAIGAGAAGPR